VNAVHEILTAARVAVVVLSRIHRHPEAAPRSIGGPAEKETKMRKAMLALVGLGMAAGAAAMPPSPGDRAALEKLAVDSDRAWDAKDIDRFAAHYSADGSVRMGGNDVITGEKAIREYFGRMFAARGDGFRHVSKVENLEMVGPDAVFADGHVRVERRQPDGSWQLLREFRNHSLVVRRKGEWRLRSVRAYPLPVRPAA